MAFAFDFRLHTDLTQLRHTQYFELTPGPYEGKHWVPGSCVIHEYTFALFEGIFEQHVPDFDHFGFVDVAHTNWLAVRAALQVWQKDLGGNRKQPPFGITLNIEEMYAEDLPHNQARLAQLLGELDAWLAIQLHTHSTIALLGL